MGGSFFVAKFSANSQQAVAVESSCCSVFNQVSQTLLSHTLQVRFALVLLFCRRFLFSSSRLSTQSRTTATFAPLESATIEGDRISNLIAASHWTLASQWSHHHLLFTCRIIARHSRPIPSADDAFSSLFFSFHYNCQFVLFAVALCFMSGAPIHLNTVL